MTGCLIRPGVTPPAGQAFRQSGPGNVCSIGIGTWR